jgi:hypothetical protein
MRMKLASGKEDVIGEHVVNAPDAAAWMDRSAPIVIRERWRQALTNVGDHARLQVLYWTDRLLI